MAWRVEPGSPAAIAGIRPGQKIVRVENRKTDSAMKRVHALPDPAQPRAMADMLHGLNALLTPGVGDTVSVWVESQKGRAAKFSLAAVPGAGLVSQFGNLPPIAGLVRTTRLQSARGCVGVIAFNIWLPALSPDLEKAVDSVRTPALRAVSAANDSSTSAALAGRRSGSFAMQRETSRTMPVGTSR